MRAKHSFCSPNRGGVPSFMPSLHIAKGLPPAFLSPPSLLPSWRIFKQTGQKGAKMNFSCLILSYLGKIGYRNSQNTNIFLKCGCRWWGWCSSRGGVSSCPLVQVCRLFVACPLLWWCVPSFRPLSCFAPDVLGLNMPLFAILRGFLAGFPCWMWVCIASMLCVACGAFVRVRCLAVLGLVACFTFRFLLFSSCPLFFSFRPALVLLPCLASALVLWVCLCCGCWLSFPFGRLQIQKEGARVASLPAVLVCSYFVKYKSVYLPAWLS